MPIVLFPMGFFDALGNIYISETLVKVCYSFLFLMFNVSNKNLTLSVSSKIQTFFKLELGYCLIFLDISLKFLQLFRTQKQLRMTNLLRIEILNFWAKLFFKNILKWLLLKGSCNDIFILKVIMVTHIFTNVTVTSC